MSRLTSYALVAFIVWILFAVALGPLHVGPVRAPQSMWLQTAHLLALAQFAYANDHDGKYPHGKNSVEICQQLLDGKYVSDPAIFYIPLPEKVKPLAGKPLKPENVCCDFTVHQDGSGLDESDSDQIPVVFVTGFRMTYGPDSKAIPVIKPYRITLRAENSLFPWATQTLSGPFGMAVAYKSNGARSVPLNDEGLIPRAISKDFNAQGKTYRQLTPDGALP